MCLSAETDLAVGVAISLVGIDAIRHVTRPRQWPLAALPLLFGVHQLVETAVWWGLDGTVPELVGRVAAWIYLTFAFALPAIIPIAAARIEPDTRRRTLMWAFAALGTVISAILLVALARGGPRVSEGTRHLDYSVGVSAAGALAVLYVLITCGAFLASSDRRVVRLGLLNLVAVAVLSWLLFDGVISLWCAWAAVISFLIAGDLRAGARGLSAAPPAPGSGSGSGAGPDSAAAPQPPASPTAGPRTV